MSDDAGSAVCGGAAAGHRRRARILPGLFAAVLAVAVATAQEPPVVTCRACGNHGVLDCSKHKKPSLEQERAVRFCSAVAACKTCDGALHVDCKQCTNEAAQDELEKRIALVAQWRETRKKEIDANVRGEPLLHLETEHVDLAFAFAKVTVGKQKLDTHEGLHLYGDRIEAFRRLYVETMQVEEKDFSARLRIAMCRDGEQANQLAPRMTGMGGNFAVGTKLMGIDAVYCMWQEPRGLPDDEAVHRNLVHNLTHLLTSNCEPAAYFGNPGNGWVDEGLAHWFEDKVLGKCTNYCFEEVLVQQGQNWKGGKWRPAVRAMLDAGELQSVAALGDKNTDQLTFPEHAQAFAMVDHLLVVHGGAKLRDFVRALKQKTAMRDAMQQVYGTSPLAFDKEFQEWVRANYSPLPSSR